MKPYLLLLALWVVFAFISLGDAHAQWSFDFETGVATTGYNDVQIPGGRDQVWIPEETPTPISLSKDLKADAVAFWRMRVGYTFGGKHNLSILIAPLRIHSKGTIDGVVRFNKVEFPLNATLESRYRFDSYRLTYRYDFHRRQNLILGIGLTAKIRDASISLTDGITKTEKKNTGPVPLINFRAQWQFYNRLGLLLDGDALAAPQGRAEDVLLALTGDINRRLRLRTGYRILEGGADNDEVYTFALINYFLIGAEFRF